MTVSRIRDEKYAISGRITEIFMEQFGHWGLDY